MLFLGEIKARTTADKNVVKECYEGLSSDFSYRLATTLRFQERMLRLSKQTKKADILARFANPHRFGSFKKNGQAIVIADADTWEPEAITRMSAEKRRIRYPNHLGVGHQQTTGIEPKDSGLIIITLSSCPNSVNHTGTGRINSIIFAFVSPY